MDRYDDMTETQARFFGKWLFKLRPKLAVLKLSPLSKLTDAVLNDGLVDILEAGNALPLDADEFLAFISS